MNKSLNKYIANAKNELNAKPLLEENVTRDILDKSDNGFLKSNYKPFSKFNGATKMIAISSIVALFISAALYLQPAGDIIERKKPDISPKVEISEKSNQYSLKEKEQKKIISLVAETSENKNLNSSFEKTNTEKSSGISEEKRMVATGKYIPNTKEKPKVAHTDKIKKPVTIHTIKMTDAELADFGISFDKMYIEGEFYPTIVIINKTTSLSKTISAYSKKQSTHKIVEISDSTNKKYLKYQPDLVTNFDGTTRAYVDFQNEKIDGLDEFMVFNKNLSDLYRLNFNKDKFPAEIPKEINQQLIELQNLTSEYQSEIEKREELGKQIDIKLETLYGYFNNISDKFLGKPDKVENSPDDSNFTSTMVLFSDNEPTQTELDYVKDMAKLGIKVEFSKHPLTMMEFLKKNYKDLEISLAEMKKQVDNFIMINKMVAIEIPYLNDPEKEGLIFWYRPNQELIDALPERFRKSLSKEFKLLEKDGAVCGQKINIDKTYLDVWNVCSGSIENLRVFPNPVKSDLNLRFELKESRMMSFTVYEISGNKILDLSENQNLPAGTNSLYFNLSKLQTGIYLIVGNSEAGESVLQRIIKE